MSHSVGVAYTRNICYEIVCALTHKAVNNNNKNKINKSKNKTETETEMKINTCKKFKNNQLHLHTKQYNTTINNYHKTKHN